ncbi:MAG: hypothetical protein ABIQ72_17200 [Usitatibacter sp.]
MPLDLVVPDLLPTPARDIRLPQVEKWLARADVQRVKDRGLEGWLASQFSLHPGSEPGKELPVAAITLAADAGAKPGDWLRADPVHMRIGQDAVSLHDASILAITQAEAAALLASLQELFASDGLEFSAPVPDRWYVRVPAGEMPKTTHIDDAVGRNVFRLLPKGEGRINWGSAITETQMVMSSHAVNTARERTGQPAINSVWFWGGGALPMKVEAPYSTVHASNALARGLAMLAGIKLSGAADIRDIEASGSVLVVVDCLTTALRSGDETAWSAAAKAIDQSLFAHLGELAARFGGVRLVLPTERDTLVATISPAAKWRWFRRAQPLATHA